MTLVTRRAIVPLLAVVVATLLPAVTPAAGAQDAKPAPKMILGTADADDLRGGSRAEVLRGGAGDDELHGGGGRDRLDGGPGDDALNGGRGADSLDGGPGDDALNGGRGADKIADTEGATTVDTGTGNGDMVDVADGAGDDSVTCGGANAVVSADPDDQVDAACGERGGQVVTVQAPRGSQNPGFSISPSSHDFGDVNVGQTSGQFEFTLRNEGSARARFSGLNRWSGNPDDVRYEFPNCADELRPGDTCTWRLAFAPKSAGVKRLEYWIAFSFSTGENAMVRPVVTGNGK